jgi:hypothetical protein
MGRFNTAIENGAFYVIFLTVNRVLAVANRQQEFGRLSCQIPRFQCQYCQSLAQLEQLPNFCRKKTGRSGLWVSPMFETLRRD